MVGRGGAPAAGLFPYPPLPTTGAPPRTPYGLRPCPQTPGGLIAGAPRLTRTAFGRALKRRAGYLSGLSPGRGTVCGCGLERPGGLEFGRWNAIGTH
ncbi:hypothetical protein GCM10011583_37590 [Streptomyces camponoticapitis]|uniref:Uncharacterized protein n=1 Tax=Streptomyces camponoticapitis TaxID=1616125 RepID=A0ABQ2EC07_9ACTN|nr:hypothetical protein GCM10011583_37590 [Streptomyces camponoticapitis]